MRLIDADKCLDALDKIEQDYENACIMPNWYTAIGEIKQQPTAYSVDKVVEELEHTMSNDGLPGEIIWNNVLKMAIEIVKQGDVSDDFCEYKIKDKMIYASCNNKQIASAFCWFNECGDYKYCPYCGKKIKVVE